MTSTTGGRQSIQPSRVFNLAPLGAMLPSPLAAVVQPSLEGLLHFGALNRMYHRLGRKASPRDFCQAVLNDLDVSVRVRATDMAKVPKTGSLMVMSNHPFGGLDGLMLAAILLSVRPDAKVMANFILAQIPDLRRLFIFVNPFGNPAAVRQNIRGLRRAMRSLRNGKALGIFPAGEVAHLQVTKRQIADPPWSTHAAALARRTNASVLPVRFLGANGPMFHMAGLIHPRLRTVLLIREILNKRRQTFCVRVGTPIPPARMAQFKSDRDAILYARLRCDVLASRRPAGRFAAKRSARKRRQQHLLAASARHPLAPAVPRDLLLSDIARLPASAELGRSADLAVHLAAPHQIPNLLREVGRLRELTFRNVGEGTGKPFDLDRFDDAYLHLLLWNHAKGELAGSYRLGLLDLQLQRHGRAGVYSWTLFDFPPDFLGRLGPVIELGRSFVRPEYQRGFAPLMLLWRGIGRFMADNPRYRYLIGPVSISDRYCPASRALIAHFLSRPENLSPLADQIRPRRPFDAAAVSKIDLAALAHMVKDLDELSEVIQDVEAGRRGVPILLKQYLRLGAKALAFNLDPGFGDCLDCLCLFNILEADPRVMSRYLGPAHITKLRAAWGLTTHLPAQAAALTD